MTDADVAFDRERQRQPDARVTGDVQAHFHDVDLLLDIRNNEDQIEDVVDGERGQIVVGRRSHPLPGQHDDVEYVPEHSEYNDDRNGDGLHNFPSQFKLESVSVG